MHLLTILTGCGQGSSKRATLRDAQWAAVSVFTARYVVLLLSLPLCISSLPAPFSCSACVEASQFIYHAAGSGSQPQTQWLMTTVHTLKHLALFRWHTSYYTGYRGLLNAGSLWDCNQTEWWHRHTHTKTHTCTKLFTVYAVWPLKAGFHWIFFPPCYKYVIYQKKLTAATQRKEHSTKIKSVMAPLPHKR